MINIIKYNFVICDIYLIYMFSLKSIPPLYFSFDHTRIQLMVANHDSDSVLVFNFHEDEVSVNQQIQVNNPNSVIEILKKWDLITRVRVRTCGRWLRRPLS